MVSSRTKAKKVWVYEAAAFNCFVAGDRLCGRPSVFSARVGLFKTNLTERSPMTNDMMNMRWLVEKSADADLLREMIGFAAERLMELEVGGAIGADFGEKKAALSARLCFGVEYWL